MITSGSFPLSIANCFSQHLSGLNKLTLSTLRAAHTCDPARVSHFRLEGVTLLKLHFKQNAARCEHPAPYLMINSLGSASVNIQKLESRSTLWCIHFSPCEQKKIKNIDYPLNHKSAPLFVCLSLARWRQRCSRWATTWFQAATTAQWRCGIWRTWGRPLLPFALTQLSTGRRTVGRGWLRSGLSCSCFKNSCNFSGQMRS